MIEPVKVVLNYDERTAIITLRKAMRSPERATHIIQALLKDQSKELAYHALKQVGKEMNDLLEINRAFSNATQRIMKELGDEPTSTRQDDEGSSEHAPQGLLLRPAGPLPEDG